MKPIRLTVVNRGDGTEIQFTASYRGKRPTKGESKEEVRKMLQEALDGLDKAEYGGSAEDDRDRLKRDSWLVTTR